MAARRVHRYWFLAAAALLASLVGGAIEALRRPELAQRLCLASAALAGRELGLSIGVESCRIDPLSASIELTRFAGHALDEPKDHFSVERIELRLRPLQALAGGLWVERISLTGLDLDWRLAGGARASRRSLLSGGCWSHALRLVHVEELEVRDARVRTSLGPVALDLPRLTVRSTLQRGVYHATAESVGSVTWGAASTPGKSLALHRVAATVELDASHDRLTVLSAALDAEGARLMATGRIDDLCHPRPDLELEGEAPIPLLSRLAAPGVPGARGTVDLDGKLAGRAGQPVLTLRLRTSDAELAGYRLGTATLVGNLERGRLQIGALKLELDQGGEAEAHGELGFSRELPLTLEVALRRVALARTLDRVDIKHSLVDFRFDGKAHLAGRLAHGFGLAGGGSGTVTGLTVDDWGWDRPVTRSRILTARYPLQISTRLRVDADRVHLDRLLVSGGGNEVHGDASIAYDPRAGVRVKAQFPQLDLTGFERISTIPWAGHGSGSVSIGGSYDDPLLDGHVDVDGFHFNRLDLGHVAGDLQYRGLVLAFPILFGTRGRTGYSVSGSVDFGHELRTQADVDVSSGRIEDLTAAIQALDPALPSVHEALAGVFAGHAHVQGPILSADATAELDLGGLTVFGRPFSHGAVSLRLERGRRLFVDELAARFGEGRVAAEGVVGTDGSLDLRYQVEGAPLGLLLTPGGSSGGDSPGAERFQPFAVGRIDAAGTLTGSFADWRPAGEGTIEGLRVLRIGLGRAQLRFETHGRELEFEGRAGDEETTQGKIELRGQGPYEAVITGATERLGAYLEGYGLHDPPAGSLAGKVTLHGDFLEPERSKGKFDIARLSLSREALQISSEAPFEIDVDAGSLSLRGLVLQGMNTRLALEGSRGATGALQGNASGQLDVRLLEGLLPHVDRVGGILSARADFHGTWAQPTVIGTANLERGQFSWIGLPLSARELRGRAIFSQSKVVISEARGQLNGGAADLAGELRLDGFQIDRCDLVSKLSQVPLRIPENIPSVVDGRLALYGALSAGLVMSGELHVTRARYNQELEIDRLLDSWRRPAPRRYEARQGAGPPLHLDIRIVGDGDVRVDNDFAQLALAGELRLTGTSERTGLLGTVTAKDGLVQFRGNQYHVGDATFTFDNPERVAPAFDLTADTDARQYRVFVHAYGTPESYKLSLHSQPALGEDDILKLLTFGVTSQDAASIVGAAGQAGYLGDVLWNLSGLHDQVRRIIPRNPFIKDFSFNIGSAFLESTGQVEPVAQIESRILSDSLRLRAQLPLSEYTGKRAEAEYQLSDHVSVQGEWNNDYSDYNVGDLGLDLRMRWEFGD